jgi:hypothetical protein
VNRDEGRERSGVVRQRTTDGSHGVTRSLSEIQPVPQSTKFGCARARHVIGPIDQGTANCGVRPKERGECPESLYILFRDVSTISTTCLRGPVLCK